jgi:glycerol-3-phosphate dehydrogenase (NAD(P)+)
MKVTVLGAGAWGTSLAKLLHEGGHQVTLWAHDPGTLASMMRTGFNERYLPGITLPRDWAVEANLERSVMAAECVVVAVPSKAFREVTAEIHAFKGTVVSVTKGIEYETGLTMCGVLSRSVPGAQPVALSGPTLALEVARGVPTAIVAASVHPEAAHIVQTIFHRPASGFTPVRIRWEWNWVGP